MSPASWAFSFLPADTPEIIERVGTLVGTYCSATQCHLPVTQPAFYSKQCRPGEGQGFRDDQDA
ncbi:hypothetical protein [Ectopseudomonas mendocina]|uniref:hypothetical protein n=1 Tax=Ectopseudomonas mendocina TaxID=300 RepID=UPI00376F2F7E